MGNFSGGEAKFAKEIGREKFSFFFLDLFRKIFRKDKFRGVAQSGSAPVSGTGGRRFKSSRPDQNRHWDFWGKEKRFFDFFLGKF